jgi:hypothetical protein
MREERATFKNRQASTTAKLQEQASFKNRQASRTAMLAHSFASP